MAEYHAGQRFQGLGVIPALLAGWGVRRVGSGDYIFAGFGGQEWELCADPSKVEQPKPEEVKTPSPHLQYLTPDGEWILVARDSLCRIEKWRGEPEPDVPILTEVKAPEKREPAKPEPGVDWSKIHFCHNPDGDMGNWGCYASKGSVPGTHESVARMVRCANALRDLTDRQVTTLRFQPGGDRG